MVKQSVSTAIRLRSVYKLSTWQNIGFVKSGYFVYAQDGLWAVVIVKGVSILTLDVTKLSSQIGPSSALRTGFLVELSSPGPFVYAQD
jgi:hypothetical protein